MKVRKEDVMNTGGIDYGNSMENCIYDLFNPEYQITGDDFFEMSVLKLSKYLHADYVFIAKLNEVNNVLEADVICDQEKLIAPFRLSLNNTLFIKVFKDDCLKFDNNIQAAQLGNRFFEDKKIKTVVSIPLKDISGKIIGVLSVLFKNHLEEERYVKTLMYMFSSRISSELEHLANERELKRQNLELLVFKEELINKNKELDKINKELRAAKLKAEESDKLKSSFLANLSHEIRTPMNAIIGFTELLKSNQLTPEEHSEYLDIVHQNGNQLLRVMDALIDISKLQARAYVDERESVSINEMLFELKEYFDKIIEVNQKPIKLKLYIDVEDGSDNIYTQKDAIYKVFDHLIDNSVKFTHKGEILIGYQEYDDFYEFFVKDTGIGVPEGEETRIFDLFRQIDTDNNRDFEGNGIGLSIVKRYIEVMKGSVWAEPNQTEGALFKFRIPKYFDA